jgi:hypothetical protein
LIYTNAGLFSIFDNKLAYDTIYFSVPDQN